MADEPVKLKDLIQSLASTMVVTSHFLDQANVDLRNQYALSGEGALASLTPPRFTLDEMTIDLAFVVEEAAVVPPGREPAPPTPSVSLTDAQRRIMLEKLDVLVRFERDTAQFEAQRTRLQRELASARVEEQNVTRRVVQMREEIETLQERIRRLSGPFAAAQRAQLQAQLVSRQVILGNLTGTQSTARQTVSTLQQQLGALKPPDRPSSFGSGPQPRTLADYPRQWADFETSYRDLKAAYGDAVEAFTTGRPLPRFDRFTPLPDSFFPALVKAGVAVATRESVEAFRSDFEATQTALGDLVGLVAALKGEGIRVRVDPESISQAAEAARQRVRLTFRAEGQETVQVEGEERDV